MCGNLSELLSELVELLFVVPTKKNKFQQCGAQFHIITT